MNMAELLGKVVKRSTERRSSIPGSTATDTSWHPPLGMHSFDREWLGSAKDVVMPTGTAGSGGCRSRSRRGGQMHELDMDILNRDEPGSSSGTHGDVESGSGQYQGDDAAGGRPRADRVQGAVEGIDRAESRESKDSRSSSPDAARRNGAEMSRAKLDVAERLHFTPSR
jgi:hypothetical protein